MRIYDKHPYLFVAVALAVIARTIGKVLGFILISIF